MFLHDHRPHQHHSLRRRIAIPKVHVERSVVVAQLDHLSDAVFAAAGRLVRVGSAHQN
jgi:hypothetical protein